MSCIDVHLKLLVGVRLVVRNPTANPTALVKLWKLAATVNLQNLSSHHHHSPSAHWPIIQSNQRNQVCMMAFSPTEYTTELNGDVPWAKPVGNLLQRMPSNRVGCWLAEGFSAVLKNEGPKRNIKIYFPTDHFQGISEAFNVGTHHNVMFA